MKPAPLLPALPFYDDEVTQGYFARIGHFHAGVGIARFCRYTGLQMVDVRDGSDAFLATAAALAGLDPEPLNQNLLRRVSDRRFQLRGETLALRTLSRKQVRFCPQCLMDDQSREPSLGDGAVRLRWSWLLRPVVSCHIHRTVLVECPKQDMVKVFDPSSLGARNEALLRTMPPQQYRPPGPLQSYVVARLEGQRNAAAWLDDQSLAQAARACEMLGSLVAEGPRAAIKSYTEHDWARVGDVGFEICAQGADAITEVLTTIRQSSGSRRGVSRPYGAFGQLHTWLEYAPKAEEAGPIRDLVRETILNTFVIGPGETVLGEVVDRRRVHSVNSLRSATGLNRKRLRRLMQKSGMITEDSDADALNQRVFPADEGERLIRRIQNAIPKNQLCIALGCSWTQAEQLVAAELVNSVVPITGGRVGLSVGAYNRDELADFLARLCAEIPVVAKAPDGYLDLGVAARGRSSTAEILHWQLEGRLRKTLRVDASQRIDRLRFCHDEIRALARIRSRPDVHRLGVVALQLGVHFNVVKRLVSAEGGSPLLVAAPSQDCLGLHGKIYVSSAEIARFKSDYLTLGRAAEAIGRHVNSVKRLLAESLMPVRDPAVLGIRLYRRQDIEAFLEQIKGRDAIPGDLHSDTSTDAEAASNLIELTKTRDCGDSDGSIQ